MSHSSSPSSSSSPFPYQSHIERTATSPRDHGLHPVTLSAIHTVNESIRLFRLRINDQSGGVKFLPGQWLDVFVPGLPKPGGFTITSTPLHALPASARPRPEPSRPPLQLVDHLAAEVTATTAVSSPSQPKSPSSGSKNEGGENDAAYLELAVQDSPSNPPAAWLWRDEASILGKELLVRVGGNFVWPPPGIEKTPENLVLVAGGVGINPLISILTHLHLTNSMPRRVTLLYSSKHPPPAPTSTSTATNPPSILFLDRILALSAHYPSPSPLSYSSSSTTNKPTFTFHLHLTPSHSQPPQTPHQQPPPSLTTPTHPTTVHHTRITHSDLLAALPERKEEREGTVCFVCGPRGMTDQVVEVLRGAEGMDGERVRCERWW